MDKIWTSKAWEQILYWEKQDKKTLKKIHNLIKAIDENPFFGIGKPEPLKNNLQGYWSRRIDKKNRLVYRIENDELIIVECGAHYGQK